MTIQTSPLPKILGMTALLLATPISAHALEAGRPGHADPRIKTYIYDRSQVFRITGHFGFVTTIQFGEGETVDSVQLGDHVSWQVDRLKRGDMLSVVPIERAHGFTNMLVTTNSRVYAFDMTARHAPHNASGGDVTFLYRFDYPKTWEEIEAERTVKAEAERQAAEERAREAQTIRGFDEIEAKTNGPINRAYRASGTEWQKPVAMLDDGQKTYIKFPLGTPMPAVFAVRPDRTEAILNHSTLPDGTLVVHGVRARLTLRSSEGVVCIYNDARTEPQKPRALFQLTGTRDANRADASHPFIREDRHDR